MRYECGKWGFKLLSEDSEFIGNNNVAKCSECGSNEVLISINVSESIGLNIKEEIRGKTDRPSKKRPSI